MRKAGLTKYQITKKRKGKCTSYRCVKPLVKNSNLCHSCKKERFKLNNPVKYAWMVLRNNAKRRKKDFSLTLEEFKLFCVKTKLLVGRGIEKDSWHIDRIDEDEGYHAWNIQVLTNSENIKKYRTYDYLTGKGSTETIVESESDNDLPF